MKGLSKIASLLITTVVLVSIAAASIFAYAKFLKTPTPTRNDSTISFNGDVVSVDGTTVVVNSSGTIYTVYLDNNTYMGAEASNSALKGLVGGYLRNSNVNVLEKVVTGSQVYVSGVPDGTSNDFIALKVYLIK